MSDPQFDVFRREPIEVSASGRWTKILAPVESIDNEGDIRFELESNEVYWMDWGSHFITLDAKIRIVDAGVAKNLGATDEAIFINNAGHSVFGCQSEN